MNKGKSNAIVRVNEIFYDLEGEGRHAGCPTLFVRLAGCNLRCAWCDTKYAYDKGIFVRIDRLAKVINSSSFFHINITGGEPLLFKKEIIMLLKIIKNKFVTIETNGSINIAGIKVRNISMDIKLPGSREHKKMIFSNLKLLTPKDQVKLVAGSLRDLNYAKKILSQHKTSALVIVQPVWGKIKASVIAKYILKNKLEWKLGLQIHKII